jgi:hypothetical protein
MSIAWSLAAVHSPCLPLPKPRPQLLPFIDYGRTHCATVEHCRGGAPIMPHGLQLKNPFRTSGCSTSCGRARSSNAGRSCSPPCRLTPLPRQDPRYIVPPNIPNCVSQIMSWLALYLTYLPTVLPNTTSHERRIALRPHTPLPRGCQRIHAHPRLRQLFPSLISLKHPATSPT